MDGINRLTNRPGREALEFRNILCCLTSRLSLFNTWETIASASINNKAGLVRNNAKLIFNHHIRHNHLTLIVKSIRAVRVPNMNSLTFVIIRLLLQMRVIFILIMQKWWYFSLCKMLKKVVCHPSVDINSWINIGRQFPVRKSTTWGFSVGGWWVMKSNTGSDNCNKQTGSSYIWLFLHACRFISYHKVFKTPHAVATDQLFVVLYDVLEQFYLQRLPVMFRSRYRKITSVSLVAWIQTNGDKSVLLLSSGPLDKLDAYYFFVTCST